MTPDPGHVGADPSDPQSWNGYDYSANDPVNQIDPAGTDCILCTMTGSCAGGSSDYDFYRYFILGDVLLTGTGERGEGLIVDRKKGAIGRYEYYDERTLSEVGFDSIVDGTQRAKPTVDLLGAGLMIFGGFAAPGAMTGVQCVTIGCSPLDIVTVVSGSGVVKALKIPSKITRQMKTRGWSEKMVQEAIDSDTKVRAAHVMGVGYESETCSYGQSTKSSYSFSKNGGGYIFALSLDSFDSVVVSAANACSQFGDALSER